MAKKKPAKDAHKSGFMVRLPEAYRGRLKKLTGRTKRKITTEVQVALDKHFKDESIE